MVSQVWSVVGMQIPFGRNYWSRLVLLPRYKRVRTPPICWSPRRYSPVIGTQPSKAIKGNKMYRHKNYTFFVIVSVVPLKKKTNKREFLIVWTLQSVNCKPCFSICLAKLLNFCILKYTTYICSIRWWFSRLPRRLGWRTLSKLSWCSNTCSFLHSQSKSGTLTAFAVYQFLFGLFLSDRSDI